MLTRVSQMHEALASIVDACQYSDSRAAGERRQQQEQEGNRASEAEAGAGAGGSGGERGRGGGGRRDWGGGGEGGGGQEAVSSVVTAEEGAVILERSRSCLRVSVGHTRLHQARQKREQECCTEKKPRRVLLYNIVFGGLSTPTRHPLPPPRILTR